MVVAASKEEGRERADVRLKKEKFSISLVRLDEHNFLKTIRQKLYWGIDSRN